MGHRIEFHLIDAFTDKPFAGNPAGVCLLDAPAEPAWMQSIAAEVNASETAFVRARPEGDFDLRWFTPACEVKLCGHATLASAFGLFSTGRAAPGQAVRFHTASGVLTCRIADGWVQMDFPRQEVQVVPPSAQVHQALSALAGAAADAGPGGAGSASAPPPLFVGQTVGPGYSTWFVAYASAKDVRALAPDFARLNDAGGSAIVTAPADQPGFDFVSRFFGPGFGVNEDPVTGSAHCSLAPFWASRLGRTRLTGLQVSRRTGVVRVEALADQVLIWGQAVTVARGEMVC